MDVFEIYGRSRSIEMMLLEVCHRQSDASLREKGVPAADVGMLQSLANIYFGATTFSKRQRRAVQAARKNSHSFTTLQAIEQCAARTRNSRDAWELREQLCTTSGDTETIAKEGARLLRLHRKKSQKPRKPSVRKYLHGDLATLSLTGKSHVITDMFSGLKQRATDELVRAAADSFSGATWHHTSDIANTDDASLHGAMLRAAEDIFFGTSTCEPTTLGIKESALAKTSAACAIPETSGTATTGAVSTHTATTGTATTDKSAENFTITRTKTEHESAPKPNAFSGDNGNGRVEKPEPLHRARLSTTVVMTLDEATRIEAGEGDDIKLHLTNGSTMTGAEYVRASLEERRVSDEGYLVLVDVLRGPVNAYRTQRFANKKQRIMALAENPTCSWPGCRRPGDECQIHHMEAWKFGGVSNAENFATLCAYHNGINDDDPTTFPIRGRMERVAGKIQRVFTPHSSGEPKMGASAIAQPPNKPPPD